MKIIKNKYIPFKGFRAINLFGVIFLRSDFELGKYTINHESIHTEQMKELLYIFFYIWYILEWLIRLIQFGCKDKIAYMNISFEKEAFINQGNENYLRNRKRYSFLKYIKS